MTTHFKQQFEQKGYCLLEQGLPETLLQQWREISEKIESGAIERHNQGSQMHGAAIVDNKFGPRLMRFNDIFSVAPQLVLETLACPAMLTLTKELSGQGSVPIQMDIVYKQQHPHPVIDWHQDAQHSRKYPYLNIGIYLDDAPKNDGCLRYVSDTQYELQDVQGLSEKYGWDIPGAAEQPAKAGDILVQDMMILHGSQPKRSEGVRRTIYIEVRPWMAIVESGSQSEAWSNLRRKWMSLVLQHDEQGIWPQQWKQEYPEAPEGIDGLFKTILHNREPVEPAVWANSPVVHPDYPIPRDMRDW